MQGKILASYVCPCVCVVNGEDPVDGDKAFFQEVISSKYPLPVKTCISLCDSFPRGTGSKRSLHISTVDVFSVNSQTTASV